LLRGGTSQVVATPISTRRRHPRVASTTLAVGAAKIPAVATGELAAVAAKSCIEWGGGGLNR
jgi:hypothetical protein